MINIGGFGHSGNTALLDFISDSSSTCPVGYEYTETALFRSVWGMHGVKKYIDNSAMPLDPRMLRDCLLGIQKEYSENVKKPTVHDFVRNARVRGYLGDGYLKVVDDFVVWYSDYVFNSTAVKVNEHQFTQAVNYFFEGVVSLARSKICNTGSILIFRNDPAAAGIELLEYLPFKFQLVTIRDPRDTAYEWILFYKYDLNKESVKVFIKQFKTKLSKFQEAYSKLSDRSKSKIKIIEFEELVSSEKYRKKLMKQLKLEYPQSNNKFKPEVSISNIGVRNKFPKDLLEMIENECLEDYISFKNSFIN